MTAITSMFRIQRWRRAAIIGFTLGVIGGGFVPLLLR
jgi:hypothetical protein